jgi:NADPH-dependent 2,4-dienoyl-CoA reductase/sulfur reductase-like enzyme/peroxiredoxin family protein/rhodanese-related sulfurtransferase/TusA-related sulfurtransferase
MKVVIVGGVAAGASTAARLRRLDERAEIVVLEKGAHVSFANCGLPYHIGGAIKERDSLLLQTPQSLKASLNLDVRIGHEARRIDRGARKVAVFDRKAEVEYEEPYDKLVLCPGATPVRPNLPGSDHPKLLVLRNVEDMDRIKAIVDGGAKRAVVIGGGYIGVEMAENLRERGVEVSLVEMLDQLMPPLDPEMAHDLQVHMQAHGVKLHLGTAAAAFRNLGGNLLVELKNGELLTSDIGILAVGVRPDATLARDAGLELGPRGGIRVDEHLRTSDPDIYAAGDAIEVKDAVTDEAALIPLAGPANRQGRIVAENIAGRDSKYRATQGSAIVKVFDMTGGGTGSSEKTLKRLGRQYRKVYIHPSGHAGYYPGTAPMHMKVLFAPDTGRLLGAQVVGYDGVDKRLDVLATAVHAGMTVHDLEMLELAYAPPYGSARDPVNMAGFVASNLLRGDVKFWYPEQFPKDTDGGFVLDVRSPDEFNLDHIPGAVNIPLGKLRSRLADLPRDKAIFIYCKVGFRSYLAYRLLVQNGFTDAATLAGGFLTFRCFHHSRTETGKAEKPFLAYAEEKMALARPKPSGKTVNLDCTGLQCPGPIKRLSDEMVKLASGDELVMTATDPGFQSDARVWCERNGHELTSWQRSGPKLTAHIRKGSPGSAQAPAAADRSDRKTLVVFSGDLDKVLAAFVIANGASTMGAKVSMFFTFWGLNALRREQPPPVEKDALSKMFGMMMPRGAERLKLSKLNMLGAGTAMMKHVMSSKNVDSLPTLMTQARHSGVRLIACSMSMDVMGIKREELIDGVEIGGVATFLGEADQSGTTMFI